MARAPKNTEPVTEPETEVEQLPDPALHVFASHAPLYYPEARDEAGALVGAVEPGDCRVLRVPLDDHWQPATQTELGEWIEHTKDADGLRLLGIEPVVQASEPAALATELQTHPGTGVEMTGTEGPADGTAAEVAN